MIAADFATCMAYAEAACGKQLSKEQMAVYHDLLGDLPREQLMAGVKRAALEHRYATVPPAGMIRELAIQPAPADGLTEAKAWELGWAAVGRMDPDVPGSVERALAKLPAAVAETIKAMGIPALCYGKEPVSVVRAQFTKFYGQISQAKQRHALLPPALRDQIARIGREEPVKSALRISEEPRAIAGKIGRGAG